MCVCVCVCVCMSCVNWLNSPSIFYRWRCVNSLRILRSRIIPIFRVDNDRVLHTDPCEFLPRSSSEVNYAISVNWSKVWRRRKYGPAEGESEERRMWESVGKPETAREIDRGIADWFIIAANFNASGESQVLVSLMCCMIVYRDSTIVVYYIILYIVILYISILHRIIYYDSIVITYCIMYYMH